MIPDNLTTDEVALFNTTDPIVKSLLQTISNERTKIICLEEALQTLEALHLTHIEDTNNLKLAATDALKRFSRLERPLRATRSSLQDKKIIQKLRKLA